MFDHDDFTEIVLGFGVVLGVVAVSLFGFILGQKEGVNALLRRHYYCETIRGRTQDHRQCWEIRQVITAEIPEDEVP